MLRLASPRHLIRRNAAHIRFKATTPPRQPRADLASIPQAIREILPRRPEPDPNAPPRKKRGLLFYVLLASPLFIWMQVEKHFDPQPLLDQKRRRLIQSRLHSLRNIPPTPFADSKAVVAYLRTLFSIMLPPDIRRHMRSDQVCTLLEEECPAELLVWLQEMCDVISKLSQVEQDADKEVELGEKLEDTVDGILRRCYQTVHSRLQPQS